MWCLAAALTGGCALSKKPYAGDPLIRSSHAVWGDRGKAKELPDAAPPEPEIPRPPNLDFVGAVPR
jgi:hypothetical protein